MQVTSRSAMIQARVHPRIKAAGENVLRRIGMTMTEAMELFLRRVIVDQRLPFDVVALDESVMTAIFDESGSQLTSAKALDDKALETSAGRTSSKGSDDRKISKRFSATSHAPSNSITKRGN